MTGERSYTTKIWQQPSSIEFSSADALSTSMDPPGEPVISTRKRPCQKIQNGSEFPELVAQNSRNPHQEISSVWQSTRRFRARAGRAKELFDADSDQQAGVPLHSCLLSIAGMLIASPAKAQSTCDPGSWSLLTGERAIYLALEWTEVGLKPVR